MDRQRRSRLTQPAKSPARLLERPDFVEEFLRATENISSPEIFRKWGAIAAIAGALERKVWVRTLGSNLYPNLYVVLVASPGVGKSEVTWRVRDLWKKLEGYYVASSSVTKASLMDELAQANRRWITHNPENPVDHFNSLLLCINELGVLLPAYENEFMNSLTDLWDCKDYSETRRTRKNEPISIEKTQLNMFAACTPSYLMHLLPEGAWDQGFISRTILVFSGEMQKRSLFADYSADTTQQEFLQEQLGALSTLWGEMRFTEEAAELIDHFHMVAGDETKPAHPKLYSYAVRRTAHLLKLTMVASASRSNDLIIEAQDYRRAFDWLIEVERYMPDIFKAMATGGTGKVMEEAWYFLFQHYSKTQEPVPEHKLIQFLQERVPVHNIKNTIDMLEQGKAMEKRLTAKGTAWIPLGKRN